MPIHPRFEKHQSHPSLHCCLRLANPPTTSRESPLTSTTTMWLKRQPVIPASIRAMTASSAGNTGRQDSPIHKIVMMVVKTNMERIFHGLSSSSLGQICALHPSVVMLKPSLQYPHTGPVLFCKHSLEAAQASPWSRGQKKT